MRRQIGIMVIMVFVLGMVFGCMVFSVAQGAHKTPAARALYHARGNRACGLETPGQPYCGVCMSAGVQAGCGIEYFPVETLLNR